VGFFSRQDVKYLLYGNLPISPVRSHCSASSQNKQFYKKNIAEAVLSNP
jgi:hypothetical protein